eukprot:Filipodium_phascolosomae@DN1062_c0_g1_i1.p1
MPHSFGYKARTRGKFSKDHRKHGPPSVSKYLQKYKRGDFVDILVDSAIARGQPHHFYHGRVGTVFAVRRHALGVEVKKRVRTREILKRINIRVEHVRPSRCREDFHIRMKRNEELRAEAKKAGLPKPNLKRQPDQPKAGQIIPPQNVLELTPIPYKVYF